MTISKKTDGSQCVMTLSGRLDTSTAIQLENEYKTSLNGISDLILDFTDLEYLSSAGLRVILAMQRIMNKQGTMVLKNVTKNIMEVFEVTGFVDILTIK